MLGGDDNPVVLGVLRQFPRLSTGDEAPALCLSAPFVGGHDVPVPGLTPSRGASIQVAPNVFLTTAPRGAQ